MSQQKKYSFIATRGWEVNDEVGWVNSNSYSMLARSLERNIKNYGEKKIVSNQKSIEKSKIFSVSRKAELIKKRYLKIPSEQTELPIIARGNKQILVFKTIEMDSKIKHKEQKQEKTPKYNSINLLTLPKNDENQHNKERQQERQQKQSNKKYERIRQHRANKTSRRLCMHFKSREQMQTLTQQTLQKYLLQRTKKHSLQNSNVFYLPVVSR